MKRFLLAMVFLVFLSFPPVVWGTESGAKTASCPNYPLLTTCNLTKFLGTGAKVLGDVLIGPTDSVLITFGRGIGLLVTTPPVSGSDYVAFMAEKIQIPGAPKVAYAATGPGGIGYQSLTPILKLWSVFRNLAYFVFAIVFVVIGLMIIFRVKIDAKTVASIENSLPKIVLSLIVVTFSYAIAGFMVDVMYVAIALSLTVLGSVGTGAYNITRNVIENNIFSTIFDGNTWGMIGNAAGAINVSIQNFFGQNALQAFSGNLVGFLGGSIGYLIIAVALIWAVIQTWIKLLQAYAKVILSVVFAPLQLMFDAIPGQNQLDGWLRTLLANLLAFPTVIVMIAIGQILAMGDNSASWGASQGFSPPLLGDVNQQAVTALVGIAIILTIPKTLEILEQTFKAPQMKWGNAWGEATDRGRQVVSFAGGLAAQRYGKPIWDRVSSRIQSLTGRRQTGQNP